MSRRKIIIHNHLPSRDAFIKNQNPRAKLFEVVPNYGGSGFCVMNDNGTYLMNPDKSGDVQVFKTRSEAEAAAEKRNRSARDSMALSRAQIKAKERSGKWSWAKEPRWDGSEFEILDNENGGKKILVRVSDPTARDVNAFEHNVSREQEERNRDAAYRDSGIVRVLADRGTPSPVPPAQKPKPSTPKEEQAAAHKFYDNKSPPIYRANDKRRRSR